MQRNLYLKILAVAVLLGIFALSAAIAGKTAVTMFFPESAPARFFEPPEKAFQESTRNAAHPISPITRLRWHDLPHNATISVGEHQVRFSTDPAVAVPNQSVALLWDITDITGKSAELDTTIHSTAIHAYYILNDFVSDLVHIHPSRDQEKPSLWKDAATFSASGLWYLYMQFAKGDTVYNFVTPIEVAGSAHQDLTPDFSRVKTASGWEVKLSIEQEPVRANGPALFTFTVSSADKNSPREIQPDHLMTGHNVIIAEYGKPFLWNIHGDRSVEAVSAEVRIPVERLDPTITPFAYRLSLPRPGLWLLRFEIQSQPVHFFVNVI